MTIRHDKMMRTKTYWRYLSGLVVAICYLLLSPPASAQSAEETQVFAQSLDEYEEGQYKAAADGFSTLAGAPGFIDGEAGSAAYWLGLSYWAQGNKAEAFGAWRNGLRTLKDNSRYDYRLADTYVRSVFREHQTSDYGTASLVYLEMLESLGKALQKEEQQVIDRHLAQAIFLLPETNQQAVEQAKNGQTPAGEAVGAMLATWWRSQDPLPGTRRNERLEEHLERVAYAEDTYPYSRSDANFDDRGMVYVRLGKPRNTSIIRMIDRGIIKSTVQARRSGLELKSNEFWSYGHIDLSIYFLFVQRGGRYQISLPEDLVPESLKSGVGVAQNFNNTEIAGDALIQTWQIIYGQLSLLHPDFINQINELDDLTSGRNTGQSRTNFALTNKMRYGRQDQTSADKRDEATPASFTEVLSETVRMPVEARVARFLNDDGTTRTEIYWAHPPGSLLPDRDALKLLGLGSDTGQYLIALTAIEKSLDYEVEDLTRQRYLVEGADQGELRVQSMVLEDNQGRYHVGVQWNEHFVYGAEGDNQVRVGPQFKTGVFRVDSLQALDPDPGVLAISDLKPVFAIDPDEYQAELSEVGLDPYPFQAVTTRTPVGLYFELYHLGFGADDRTRYNISYKVGRQGDERATNIAAGTELTGSTRTSPEYISLDLSSLSGLTGDIEVVVQVTDETTGQQVQQSVLFSLYEGE